MRTKRNQLKIACFGLLIALVIAACQPSEPTPLPTRRPTMTPSPEATAELTGEATMELTSEATGETDILATDEATPPAEGESTPDAIGNIEGEANSEGAVLGESTPDSDAPILEGTMESTPAS